MLQNAQVSSFRGLEKYDCSIYRKTCFREHSENHDPDSLFTDVSIKLLKIPSSREEH